MVQICFGSAERKSYGSDLNFGSASANHMFRSDFGSAQRKSYDTDLNFGSAQRKSYDQI